MTTFRGYEDNIFLSCEIAVMVKKMIIKITGLSSKAGNKIRVIIALV